MSKFGYFPGKNVNNNVTSFLELHAKENPSQIAFYWVGPEILQEWPHSIEEPLMHQTMTMGELAKSSAHVAAGFLKLGVKQGDRLILFVPMSPQLYVAMSALQRIGAIPVFLDSWTRRTNLMSSIHQAQPIGIISYDKVFQFGKNIPELGLIPIKISIDQTDVVHSAILEDLAKTESKAPITAMEQEDTALITFTTGSSGTPKGANRTHRFLAAQHYALDRYIPYAAEDIDLPVFPVFTLNNIAAGVSTVIPAIDVGEPNKRDPLILLGQIKSCEVNCATLSPSLLNAVAQYCRKTNTRMPNLRRLVTGGAPISRDDVERFKSIASARILILYGSTEVEPMAHISDEEIDASSAAGSDVGVKVGHVDTGLRYKLLKIQKKPIEVKNTNDWAKLESLPGEAGEFIVAGEHVCNDYYKNPEALKRAKIKDLDGTVWHRTGDVVRIDEGGYLWVLGRVHNTIMRNQEYLFPVQPEIILKRLSFVRTAAYLGMQDAQLGEKAVAVIVSKKEPSGKTASWKSQIQKAFQSNHIPVDEVLFCDHMPMDPRHHSKVEYDLLRRQLIGAGQI